MKEVTKTLSKEDIDEAVRKTTVRLLLNEIKEADPEFYKDYKKATDLFNDGKPIPEELDMMVMVSKIQRLIKYGKIRTNQERVEEARRIQGLTTGSIN